MMWNGMDKRRFPRAHYPCWVSLRKKRSSKVYSTETENIGQGGIRVLLKDDLGLFSAVDLKIDLKDTRPEVECEGMVVWVVKRAEIQAKGAGDYDTGIEFFGLKEEDEARIRLIVERALKGA